MSNTDSNDAEDGGRAYRAPSMEEINGAIRELYGWHEYVTASRAEQNEMDWYAEVFAYRYINHRSPL